jgi:dephospho-CoA kinase
MNPGTRSHFVVGLTGGIGSGKSSAASRFQSHGAYVIDADAIAHALTAPNGPAIAPIDAEFPGVLVDGVLDRAMLRDVVFSDPARRTRLESILHPMVRASTQNAMMSVEAQAAPYVMLMVPLLFESPTYADRIDCAVLVDVDEETQVRRVSTTRNVPADTVRRIIAAQMPRSEKLLRTQFIIDNSGSRNEMEARVDTLHDVLAANARHLTAHRRATATKTAQ